MEDTYTNDEIFENGSLVDMYPYDFNEYGEPAPNGSEIRVYKYLGEYYEIQVSWDDNVVNPDEIANPMI